MIREDNTATFFVGKTDLGQGTGTAFRQIMSDELDMAYDRTSCVMGSTDVTPDQGGSGGSDALQVDGYPMRRVAAEGRRVLLEMASARFGVPVAALSVRDGVVSVTADPTRQVTYGQLIGGRRFNVTLTGDNASAAAGTAPLKNVQDLRWSGQPLPRYDIPPKVDGSLRVGGRREAARHGAREKREAAIRRRHARERRRSIGAQPARLRAGRPARQLSRGRLRARGAGHSRGYRAEGHLDPSRHGAVSDVRESVRLHA